MGLGAVLARVRIEESVRTGPRTVLRAWVPQARLKDAVFLVEEEAEPHDCDGGKEEHC